MSVSIAKCKVLSTMAYFTHKKSKILQWSFKFTLNKSYTIILHFTAKILQIAKVEFTDLNVWILQSNVSNVHLKV